MLPAVPTPAYSYEVQTGDTLWSIAQRAYGNPLEWPTIYNANKLIQNPNLIKTGWRLYIPKHSAGYSPRHALVPSVPTVLSATQLTSAEVGNLWLQAGGPQWAENESECIAWNESGDNADANNYTDNYGTQTSWGLFQISNGTHEMPVQDIDNPLINTEQAVAKFEAEGDSFYPDWGTAGDC